MEYFAQKYNRERVLFQCNQREVRRLFITPIFILLLRERDAVSVSAFNNNIYIELPVKTIKVISVTGDTHFYINLSFVLINQINLNGRIIRTRCLLIIRFAN